MIETTCDKLVDNFIFAKMNYIFKKKKNNLNKIKTNFGYILDN